MRNNKISILFLAILPLILYDVVRGNEPSHQGNEHGHCPYNSVLSEWENENEDCENFDCNVCDEIVKKCQCSDCELCKSEIEKKCHEILKNCGPCDNPLQNECKKFDCDQCTVQDLSECQSTHPTLHTLRPGKTSAIPEIKYPSSTSETEYPSTDHETEYQHTQKHEHTLEPEYTHEPEHHHEHERTKEPEHHHEHERTKEPEHHHEHERTKEPEHHHEHERTKEPEHHHEHERTKEPKHHHEPTKNESPSTRAKRHTLIPKHTPKPKSTKSTQKITVPLKTKSTVTPPKSTITTVKSTSKSTQKLTVPTTTKSTVTPPKLTITTVKSTSKSTQKSTVPPTTKSTVTPPKSTITTVKRTSKSTQKSTVPPTTKSTMTIKKTTACSCSPCQSGYTAYNKNCYKLHWTNTVMTHDEAEQMCRQDNTYLVSIHSLEEHMWIYDFVTKTTGYGGEFEVRLPAGNVSEGFWIGLKSINGNIDSKRQMYWSDQPNVYLKPGDYGYERYYLPWAHAPDRNPLWTICTFMWIVDPRPQHKRGSWDDAACNSTDNASDQYSKGHVCKIPQACTC